MTIFQGQLGYNLESFFMNEKAYKNLSPEDRAVIDKLAYEPFSQMAAQGFIDQDNLTDPMVKEAGIKTHQASPEFMKILEEKTTFFKDNWMADAKARGVDAQAAYDFYVKTATETASLMK